LGGRLEGDRVTANWLKRVRLIAAWCLGAYLADIFIRMGWIKFDPNGFWTLAFERWGYPPWLRVAVGLIEVVGGEGEVAEREGFEPSVEFPPHMISSHAD
jgi:hypothetical protein